jgi:hypothetical protein
METTPYPHRVCKNCGHHFEGYYCNLCGEKVIEPKDRKFKSVLSNILISTTIVDNKFIKSLRLTIFKPGFLSREYVDGRRVPYMRPLQMFFILNLIYFLFPVLQMFNSSLYTQLHVLPHRSIARNIVSEKLKDEHLTMMGFELVYNDKTTRLAKMLIVLFVVIASLPLSLIFRKKNRFFSDHMALAVELTSFNVAVNAIFLSLLFWLLNKILHWSHSGGERFLNDITLTIIFVLTNFYFIFLAAKSFYQQKGKRLILKAVLGIFGLFITLEAYRFLLFAITMFTI